MPPDSNQAIPASSFMVADWLVEPDLNRLSRGGVEIHLAPKFVHVLVSLSENQGRVVSRDSLLNRVWPEVVVSESVLTRAISELRRALGDSPSNPSYIETIPKKGYRLIAEVCPADEPANDSNLPINADSTSSVNDAVRSARFLVPVLLLVLFLGSWFVKRNPAVEGSPTNSVPLTSLRGEEFDPALSPDGDRLAFIWKRPSPAAVKEERYDLYVKTIGSDKAIQLVADDATKRSPTWSPDGKQLAFIRCLNGTAGVFIISGSGHEGNRARLITELQSSACDQNASLAWSPDGQWLAFTDGSNPQEPHGIWLLSLLKQNRLQLTAPETLFDSDSSPSFSPDGKSIVFVRGGIRGRALLKTDLETRKTTPLVEGDLLLEGFDWSPDGRQIVFASRGSLWKTNLNGTKPERITSAQYTTQPSSNGGASHLAYVASSYDVNIWRMQLTSTHQTEPIASSIRPQSIIASTRIDGDPAISPDGTSIAFISDRSGRCSLWVGDDRGRDLIELSTLAPDCMHTSNPRWSPDGRFIAFSRHHNGNSDIHVVNTTTKIQWQHTTDSSDESSPSWSRDGQWIYFSSNRSGTSEIWKISIDGGDPYQVTRRGGTVALESVDARYIYFTRANTPGIWRMHNDRHSDNSENTEELVVDTLLPLDATNWQITSEGIYYINRSNPSYPTIDYFDFHTADVISVGNLHTDGCVMMDVSSDGRWVVIARVDHGGSDILMRKGVFG